MKKMLRNFLWGGVVLSSLLVAGCAKEYDDTELRGKISDLDSRLTQLEQAVKTLNEQTVPAIQTLVNALDAKLTVTAVVTNNDGSYTILFSDNTSVTIANGEKGDKGDQGNPGDKGDPGAPGAPGATPEIGVKLIDGVYYWTINGKLIPDDNNPLPVTGQNGQDGATPTFRLNEDVLEYSVDGGKTWTPVPVVGESKPSITVEETDEAVIFTLSDGTVFQLAKELPFCIKFTNADDITIMAGETAYVGYTLQGVGEKDVTEVGILTATPGFDAEVEPYAGQNDAGIISITNNDEDDSKEHSVYVFAANGKGKTDIKGLHFASTRLQAVLSVQVVPAAGGDSFQLNVKANEDYTVEVSPAAQSWITVEQPTRALYNDKLTVTVAPNETNSYRSGTVSLISKESSEVLDQIDVLQAPVATEATDLASVSVLPDGTGVTVYNVTAIAASDSKAIITDGTTFIYANAKGLYNGVFDLNGTKNTDENGLVYLDVKSLNLKMDEEPIEVDPHAAFYYYASGANGYTYFFTVINGKVGQSKGQFYVEDSTGAVQLLLPDAPEDLGLEALEGKYAAVKAWVINGEEDKDENLFLNAIATDVKALSFADPGWAISYDQENNDAVSVAAGASDSFLFSCLSEQDILANYKSIDNFLAAAPFDNVDNFYYTTWYYNVLFGYDFDYIYSALVKTGPYEDNIKNLGFGKHYIIAVGVDEDGALTGAFACKEIEKISPYGFRTYGDYLGEYTFTNSNGVNEVWTFSENVAGESYLVSGIAGIAAANLGGGQVASAEFDPASGLVSFSNQALGEWDNNGTPLTDKFVAVWYSGSNFSSNESYMGDPLILSFGMDQEENIDIIVESDSYGPLEGFGYIATTATGSMAGKYGAVKFDNAKLVKGVVTPEPDPDPVPVPFEEDFEEAIKGWKLIDADGDGFNWMQNINGSSSSTLSTHTGNGVLFSQSYASSALTPDNWAFTPEVILADKNYISFWVVAQDLDWKAEHYGVYIIESSEGLEDLSAAELLFEDTFSADDYEQIKVAIPASYAGKTVRVGFRHFNCTDLFYLNIDDVSILEGELEPEPEIEYEDYLGEWALGTSVWTIAQKTAGESYSITGIAGQDGFHAVEALFENGQIKVSEADFGADGEGYELYLSGIITSGGQGYISYPFNSDAPDLLFTGKLDSEGNIKLSPGSNTKYNIAFTSFLFLAYLDNDNAFQSKTTSLPAVLSPYVFVPDENVYVYKEEFENSVDSWTFIDADGDGYNWALSTALDAHSGDGLIFSQSYVNQVGAITPDNWAFTPAITLTSDNYLSFWALGQDANYCAEHYAAYILTEAPTVDNLSSAEVLVPESVATKDYVQKIAQIPSKYNGQTVYIGIRHFNCTDMFYLDIDDVAVIEGEPKPTSAPAFGPSKANASAILTAKKAKTIKYINRPAVASRARGGVNVTPNASMEFVQGAGYAVRPAAPATAESSQIVLQKKQK